jgi:acyl carrier protein
MEILTFLENIKNQFDPIPELDLESNMSFKDLEGWDSMAALSIIGMIDDNYGVRISGTDFRTCETLEDLYMLVKNRS